MSISLITICLTVIIAFLAATATSASIDISGVSPTEGAISGGNTVTITGQGFHELHETNTSLLFADVPCRIEWPVSSSTELRCVTEPWPYASEGEDSPQLSVALVVNGTAFTSAAVVYQYSWSSTPQIHFIRPSAASPGTVVAFAGLNVPTNAVDLESVYFSDGTGLCDTVDPSTNQSYSTFSKDGYRWFQCRVVAEAGFYNLSVVVGNGVGRAWQHSHSFYLGPMAELIMFEVFPDVHRVSPHVSHLFGNEMLTIEGVGFSSNMSNIAVDIDGVPCSIVNSSDTLIHCITATILPGHLAASDNGTYPITTTGHRYKGTRGVAITQYHNIAGSTLNDLYNSPSYPDQPDIFSLFPSFESDSPSRYDRYGEVYDAFFTPAVSDVHYLWMSSDNGGDTLLTSGTNASLLERVAGIDGGRWTPYNSYYLWNEVAWTRYYSTQKSDALNLLSNTSYLVRGVFKEHGGGDHLQLGFHWPNSVYKTNESWFVLQEEQVITLSTSWRYERQQLVVMVNMTTVDEGGDIPELILSWDGWNTDTLFAHNVTYSGVEEALLDLFTASCNFNDSNPLLLFDGLVYDFESESTDGWGVWGQSGYELPPLSVEYEAFCGRYALEVRGGQALAFESSMPRFSTSVYPYLCMAYKIPNGTEVNVALKVTDQGWLYVPVVEGRDATTLTPLLSHFNSASTLPVIDNNIWNFTCTNVDTIIRDSLNLTDGDVVEVEGFGFFTEDNELEDLLLVNPFHVDQVSFSSDARQFQQRTAPARPGGISVHSFRRIREVDEVPDLNATFVRNITIELEILPSLCYTDDAPLVSVNVTGPGVLMAEVTRRRSQLLPMAGSFTVQYGNLSTPLLAVDLPNELVELALHQLVNATGELAVEFTLDRDDRVGRFCLGRSITVTFVDSFQELPLLQVNSTLISVGSVDVRQHLPGGFFQWPIPGHMLQTARSVPQLRVTVGNHLASCSGGLPFYTDTSTPFDYCSFIYRLATPPENITGVRDCPSPWRLSFHRATDKVWNITRYEVVYWEGGRDNETTTVNIEVEDPMERAEFELDLSHLMLDREFLFTVRSHSVEGPGDLSGEFPVCTWRCLPPPPVNLTLSRLSCPSGPWSLRWSRPLLSAEWNLTAFQVLVQGPLDGEVTNLSIQVPVTDQTQQLYAVNLTEFDVFVQYRVLIQSHGQEGPGEYAMMYDSYSPESCLPIPPVNLTITRLCPFPWKLSWERSTGLEWNLTHFEVLLHAVGSTTEEVVNVVVTAQEQGHYEVFLPQLNVSEEYQIQVQSVGQEGSGNYSDSILYTPQRCVPPPPLLGVSRVCPGPWQLSWERALDPTWNVTIYEAVWERMGTVVGMVQVPVLNQSQEMYVALLYNLSLGEEYQLRVRGINEDGPGNYSDVLVYRAEICVPGPPEMIQVFQSSATTLGVSWTRPTVSNGNITQYDVLLTQGVDRREVELRAVSDISTEALHETLFEGLEASQMFQVQVRAYTVEGPGNYSEAITVQLAGGCSVGLYNVPTCVDKCEDRCGRGNPCQSFTGMCQCNPCWRGVLCSNGVSSLCFEDYLKAVDKVEELVTHFGNTIPEPPLEYLREFLREAMRVINSEAFDAMSLTFDVESRSELPARPLAKVTLCVSYSNDPEQVLSGVEKLHQMVERGVWRATLIQQNQPQGSDTPVTSVITINV